MNVLNALGKLLGFTHDEEAEKRLSAIQQKLEYLFSDINLEKDSELRSKIESDPERWVDVADVTEMPEFKRFEVTDIEVLHCAESSRNLEADNLLNKIRTKKPFKEDPNRNERCIRVTGINLDATANLQREFFESIFSSVQNVFLLNKRDEDGFAYTGTSIVELGNADEAKEAVEKGIAFDNGVLDVILLSDFEKQLKQAKEKSPKKSPKRAQK